MDLLRNRRGRVDPQSRSHVPHSANGPVVGSLKSWWPAVVRPGIRGPPLPSDSGAAKEVRTDQFMFIIKFSDQGLAQRSGDGRFTWTPTARAVAARGVLLR